ncbi:intraflagellar transport protein 27 homolog [Tubulanus polymorphus]|uniref:intraflagellar transport protein 27 homolog n=1 Tax=Tubulanus polymorphus TaxID=672921 RepID=UPI003DA22C87
MPTVLRAKLIVTGDSTVGKSALAQVFHSDGSHFPKNYTMTTGCELCVKSVNIPETQDCVELFMYDSAGKEVFSELVQKYWDHPSLVMLVYDVTNETSFSSCSKWLERVRKMAPSPDCKISGALVANKIDLDQRRVISPKQGKEFAMNNGLEYFEVSSKEMQEVEAPFYYLAGEFYKSYNEDLDIFKSLV